jgi:hypothetical protein
VVCQGEGTCRNAIFYVSQVECSEGSCVNAVFTECSCCDGDGCPSNGSVPSCGSDTTTVFEFCSSQYLDSTCQAWGNPLCKSVGLQLETPSRPAETCNFRDDTNLCETNRCFAVFITNCTLLCFDACKNNPSTKSAIIDNSVVDCTLGTACSSAIFDQSSVRCIGFKTCGSVTFDSSTVQCLDAETCQFATFLSSAVECVFGACIGAIFAGCSCCDGAGCPSDLSIPSCGSDVASNNTFCSSQQYLGSSCKVWGNPICKGFVLQAPENPAKPAIFCNLGDDINLCRHSVCAAPAARVVTNCTLLCLDACSNNGGAHYNISNSIVDCVTGVACYFALFEQSKVRCMNGACVSADFQESTVECKDRACASGNFKTSIINCLDNSCNSGAFVASAVQCATTMECIDATFDPCSCCIGDGCPETVTPCGSTPEDITAFCATPYAEESTCAEKGNPICQTQQGGTELPAPF